jgi:hypothetical protein
MPFRTGPYTLRQATVGDVQSVALHRVAMFRDMGVLPETEAAALAASSAAFLARAIPSGDYRGWIAERDGEVIAGAGVVLRPLLPRPGHLEGGVGRTSSTSTPNPRTGAAASPALMQTVLAWCRSEQVARVTHASDEGRPLYLALGFAGTNEMLCDLQ